MNKLVAKCDKIEYIRYWWIEVSQGWNVLCLFIYILGQVFPSLVRIGVAFIKVKMKILENHKNDPTNIELYEPIAVSIGIGALTKKTLDIHPQAFNLFTQLNFLKVRHYKIALKKVRENFSKIRVHRPNESIGKLIPSNENSPQHLFFIARKLTHVSVAEI